MDWKSPSGNSALDRLSTLAIILACIFCFAAGRAFIPHLGIQNDEALFAGAIFDPKGVIYSRWVFGHKIPLMLMSYMGALKSWIYALLFQIWPPTASSTRVPMLLAGVATVWLTWDFLRRACGRRAAVLGAALLATDSLFLLTDCFDWGPVALQHLLLMTGLVLLLRFSQSLRWLPLAGGFFAFGLGLWDKALFLWMLGGVISGTVIVFPRELLRLWNWRRAGVAVAAFALGCLPLILYNGSQQIETLRGNVSYDATGFSGKARLLVGTLDGSGMFGWMIADDGEVAHPLPPRTPLQRFCVWLSTITGKPHHDLMGWAGLASLLILPALWRDKRASRERRFLLFALVFLGVAWLQMAITRNAGGSVHHTILLWPIPVSAAAAALAGASRWLGRHGRAALAAVALLLTAGNLLVLNTYYDHLTRNGGCLNWTDAVYTLSAVMDYTPAQYVYPIDWGILDSLRLLNRGRLELRVGSDPLSKPALDGRDREVVRNWIANSSNVFIDHVPGDEFFPGVGAHIREVAQVFGYRLKMLHVIADRRGTPQFEVFRFER